MYFSYDPLNGSLRFHETADEAEAACHKIVEFHKEISADDGWDENAGDVCWGKIHQRLTETSRRPVDEECDSAHDLRKFEHVVKMDLRPELVSEQQQFPTIWGVFMTSCFRSRLYDSEQEAIERAAEMPMATTVVRLIPEPEVDRLVHEAEQRGYNRAVADAGAAGLITDVEAARRERDAEQCGRDAERERCRQIADHSVGITAPKSLRHETAGLFASRNTAIRILERIESGEQPGEGAI
jgi:hypothetical protein